MTVPFDRGCISNSPGLIGRFTLEAQHDQKIENDTTRLENDVIDLFDKQEIDVLGLEESGLNDIEMNACFLVEGDLQDINDSNEPESFVLPAAKTGDATFEYQETENFFDQKQEDTGEGERCSEEEIMEKPKRSLTAYNLFFQDERKRLLKELPVQNGKKSSRRAHRKLGFTDMSKTVAANWKKISKELKMEYEYRSELDKERFAREHEMWKRTSSADRLSSRNKRTETTTNEARGFTSEPSMQRHQFPEPQQSESFNFEW